ncbi:MAG: hypothetical protein AAF696_13950 [Bacteroidota bacterium]
MRSISKIIIFFVFIGILAFTYKASAQGWGMKLGMQDSNTMSEIEKNCPDYYVNRDGECLRRTFRSYYLIRGVQGGGPGSGK